MNEEDISLKWNQMTPFRRDQLWFCTITYTLLRVVGFIVALIASALMHTPLGFIGTTLLVIVGSVIDCAPVLQTTGVCQSQPAGFLVSIIGPIVLVFLALLIVQRKRKSV